MVMKEKYTTLVIAIITVLVGTMEAKIAPI